jgi:malate dehydrogenase (quinone)
MISEKPGSGPDVALVGGGIMSATLGVLLKALQPGLTLTLFESLEDVAGESSDAWNNAGTGHAALCELNYTPEQSDGSVDIAKAITINESFEVTRQFWSWLVEQGILPAPDRFIHAVPHMTLVRGTDGVDFLRRRHQALSTHHAFDDMLFTDDGARIADWAPLIMDQRPAA